jgi:hypothetical protein
MTILNSIIMSYPDTEAERKARELLSRTES